MEKILVLNEYLEIVEVEVKAPKITLDEMQAAIGGYIERITFNTELYLQKIDVWCDEEGKLKGRPVTTAVIESDNKVIELLAGPLVFTRRGPECDSYSLTPVQIELVKKVLNGKVHIMMHSIDNQRLGMREVRVLPYR